MDANPISQFFSSADTKFYLGLAGLLWTAFKGFNWVRDIREKDLKGIKDDLGAQTHVIRDGFAALSEKVGDLSSDFRNFYISPDPLMIPVSARATRKRKSVATRVAAKARTPAKKK